MGELFRVDATMTENASSSPHKGPWRYVDIPTTCTYLDLCIPWLLASIADHGKYLIN